MRKNKSKKKNKKNILYILMVIIIISLIIAGIIFKKMSINVQNKINEEQKILKEVEENYNEFVVVNKDTILYDENGKTIGNITKGVSLHLDELTKKSSLKLLKLKNSPLYINYKDTTKSEEVEENHRYKNYIPFNESIKINDKTRLHIDEEKYYEIDKSDELPIIIKEDDKYYVMYDNKLLYINKNENNNFKIINKNNQKDDKAEEIAVLNYHFIINEKLELNQCSPSSICHSEEQFDSHVKYIKDNNIFDITMKELEMFHDGKINLPKKTVAITIDDGWFVSRAINILNKYEQMATLFLIGYLAPPSDYASPYLEVHSHTWNLHNVSTCSEGRSPLLCYDKAKIVEDLIKSRESLNNTPYFCYPFYEYNDNAITALKEAGFTMALTGGNKKVTKNDDKYKIPRYVISNTTTVEQLKDIIN